MGHHGHYLDRWAIGLVFIWFGMLKVFGYKSAGSSWSALSRSSDRSAR